MTKREFSTLLAGVYRHRYSLSERENYILGSMASSLDMSSLIMMTPSDGWDRRYRRDLIVELEKAKARLRNSDDPISRAKYKRAIQDYEWKLGDLKSKQRWRQRNLDDATSRDEKDYVYHYVERSMRKG